MTPLMWNILLALAGGEKHGYSIMLQVEDHTGGEVKPGPGSLFSAIRRMLAAGLIAESGERIDPTLDDERRRFYRLSGLGKGTLHSQAERRSQPAYRVERLLPDTGVSHG